jgi:hypothetical protein
LNRNVFVFVRRLGIDLPRAQNEAQRDRQTNQQVPKPISRPVTRRSSGLLFKRLGFCLVWPCRLKPNCKHCADGSKVQQKQWNGWKTPEDKSA